MEIMTISSLAGLGAVPGTVLTYGDALAYLNALSGQVDTAAAKLNAANTARKITPTAFNTLVDVQARVGTELAAAGQTFGAQGHGVTLSAVDNVTLATLDAEVSAFVAGVDAGVQSAGTWIWIGLAAVATTGLIMWATGKLPSYARKKRRRR